MPSFQCPIPSTLNVATANGFLLSITKLPDIEFFCTEANIPGISLPAINMGFPLSTVPVPGDVMTFDDFEITFLISEDFSNYTAIYQWMIGLGFPENTEQYKKFINTQQYPARGELAKGYSDGFVMPLSGLNNPVKTFKFIDMFPVRLEQMQLSTKFSDVVYLSGNATFSYNYFRVED